MIARLLTDNQGWQMKHIAGLFLSVVLGLLPAAGFSSDNDTKGAGIVTVRMETNKGVITLELDSKNAPKTVENFVAYAKDGFYDGTIFHRVIPGFMIQGGGFTTDMKQKSTRAPISNEAANGLKNTTGSIAMARTSDPHSATSQFFINVKDNGFLDHSSPSPQGWGYCVFGRVTDGMEVVQAIEQVPTGTRSRMQDVPLDEVVINKVTVVED
jgi:peptidyl-prolyl cis-trans isomerase B (cyclophilin B)